MPLKAAVSKKLLLNIHYISIISFKFRKLKNNIPLFSQNMKV